MSTLESAVPDCLGVQNQWSVVSATAQASAAKVSGPSSEDVHCSSCAGSMSSLIFLEFLEDPWDSFFCFSSA